MVYLDSFTTSAYPDPPKVLLSITAKQLPSFGASLETAVQDLAHYQNSGFSSLVLVSGDEFSCRNVCLLLSACLICHFELNSFDTSMAHTIQIS